MKENFPNLLKEINMKVQEAQRILNKMDAQRPTPRRIIIKMPKVKDKEGLGVGEWVRGEGIKKYKQVVTEQPWGCKLQYRKWSSQRTHTHDPWTQTMVGELPEGVGGAGWREAS